MTCVTRARKVCHTIVMTVNQTYVKKTMLLLTFGVTSFGHEPNNT
jgi:hypothetical protein